MLDAEVDKQFAAMPWDYMDGVRRQQKAQKELEVEMAGILEKHEKLEEDIEMTHQESIQNATFEIGMAVHEVEKEVADVVNATDEWAQANQREIMEFQMAYGQAIAEAEQEAAQIAQQAG